MQVTLQCHQVQADVLNRVCQHAAKRLSAIEREKQDAMSMRVRQLWAPVLSTFPHLGCGAVRSAARAAVATLGIFHAEWRIDRVAPLWMLALPFVGAAFSGG